MKKTLRYKTYWLGVFGLFLGLGNPVLGAPISEDRLPQAKNYYVDALSGADNLKSKMFLATKMPVLSSVLMGKANAPLFMAIVHLMRLL